VRLDKHLVFLIRSIYSPQRRKERKGLIIIRKSALLFFASFLTAGIFGGSTAKNKKKHLRVLRVFAVKTI